MTSLRLAIRAAAVRAPVADRVAWVLWERWISEIIADFWSVAKIGIAATLGLMGVVSLPRAFVFRIDTEDPHRMFGVQRARSDTARRQAIGNRAVGQRGACSDDMKPSLSHDRPYRADRFARC